MSILNTSSSLEPPLSSSIEKLGEDENENDDDDGGDDKDNISNKQHPWKVPVKHAKILPEFNETIFWRMIRNLPKEKESFFMVPQQNDSLMARNQITLPKSAVPVLHWPMALFNKVGQHETAEHQHIFDDGIRQSKYLKWADYNNNHSFDDPALVWIGDPGSGWDSGAWCHEFTQAVKAALVQRYQAGRLTRFPIHIVHFGDPPGRQPCSDLERLVGLDVVFYSVRSNVHKRQWNHTKQWIEFGYKFPDNNDYDDNNNNRDNQISGHQKQQQQEQHQNLPHRHVPLVVRTDIVQEIETVLQTKYNKSLPDPIEECLPRPLDVTHLWPLSVSEKGPVIVNHKYANLRFAVSNILHQHNEEQHQKHLRWNMSIGLSGKALKEGRRGIKREYVETLLNSKIIIVTQRDQWEDHYRLMEALVSGALVISDNMLAPPQGLHNGTSILFFTNPQNLLSLIHYYLIHDKERMDIAKQGRKLAMSRHRSWHRMEEIIFGRILTTCGSSHVNNKTNKKNQLPHSDGSSGDCPYTVHAS